MDLQLLKQERQFFLLTPRHVWEDEAVMACRSLGQLWEEMLVPTEHAVSLFNKLVQPGVYV